MSIPRRVITSYDTFDGRWCAQWEDDNDREYGNTEQEAVRKLVRNHSIGDGQEDEYTIVPRVSP